METVTKHQMVKRVVEKTGLRRRDVLRTIREFVAVMTEELGRGARVILRDFGIFEVRVRRARTAYNPHARTAIRVPPRTRVRFRVGARLRRLLAERDQREPPTIEVKPSGQVRQDRAERSAIPPPPTSAPA